MYCLSSFDLNYSMVGGHHVSSSGPEGCQTISLDLLSLLPLAQEMNQATY